jgi:hypothetical protein
MREIPGECRNSIVRPVHKKGDKPKVENYREISLLNACYKLHSKILNENFTPRAEMFISNARMVSEKKNTDLASVHCTLRNCVWNYSESSIWKAI